MTLNLAEETLPFFYADHTHFYQNQEPLEISVGENENTVEISLPCMPSSLLHWEGQVQEATKWVEKGKKLLWNLEFGWYNWQDPLEVKAYRQAVCQFSEEVFPGFSSHSIGAVLYKGEADSARDALLEVLYLLASALPESIPPFLLWDLRGKNQKKEQLQFLDKDCFELFVLGLRGSLVRYPCFIWKEGMGNLGHIGSGQACFSSKEKLGILLPKPLQLEDFWEDLFDFLMKENIPYRILYESFATQDWDELQEILTFEKTLTEKGKRILQGFAAAGGKTSFAEERFRGRGIRTPDLLVPNQSR